MRKTKYGSTIVTFIGVFDGVAVAFKGELDKVVPQIRKFHRDMTGEDIRDKLWGNAWYDRVISRQTNVKKTYQDHWTIR